MRRPPIVVLGVMLALVAAIPAVSKDWPIIPIGQPFVDEKRATASAPLGKLLEPDLAGITLAAEKFLTAMPADAYMTILRLWGYTEVHSMAGGLNGWKVAGLPIAHR